MLNGAFALLERSLRVDARTRSNHLARLAMLGAIYFSLCFALLTSFMFGAPGLRFFYWMAYLDVTFMTLLGVGFFSTSITEEKEEDTLGLMLMAGISPLGILLGKLGGRLWQLLLLVTVQYPFVLLAVTMGGVTSAQVWSVTIALLAYTLFLAGFGLLCSTLASRSQKAAVWMVAGLIVYFVVPGIARNWYLAHAASLAMEGSAINLRTVFGEITRVVGDVSIFNQMGTILSTGFGETAFSTQVVSNSLMGASCAGLAWLLFGVATRSPSTEANTRGLVARTRILSPFCAGRTWGNAFFWKDFHFVSGGTAMLLIRIAYYAGLGITALFFEATDDDLKEAWFGFCIFLMWLPITFDAARIVSRSLQDEIRGQTLAPLLMLPRSANGIVYSKIGGALLGWLPGPVIALSVTLISPTLRESLFESLIENPMTALMLSHYLLLLALIPHLAAFVSLYVRWGAVGLAIGLTIAIYIGLYMLLMFFPFLFVFLGFAGGMASGVSYVELMLGSMALILVGLCAACHVGILLRIQSLAAK